MRKDMEIAAYFKSMKNISATIAARDKKPATANILSGIKIHPLFKAIDSFAAVTALLLGEKIMWAGFTILITYKDKNKRTDNNRWHSKPEEYRQEGEKNI